MDGASTSAFFTNPGTSLALAFAALLIVVSYTLITINFIVTLVESYLVVSVGFIFLGFGGADGRSRTPNATSGPPCSVEVKSVLPTSDRTYEVEWVETTRDLYGTIKATDRWKGYLSIVLNPPTDERQARINPLGEGSLKTSSEKRNEMLSSRIVIAVTLSSAWMLSAQSQPPAQPPVGVKRVPTAAQGQTPPKNVPPLLQQYDFGGQLRTLEGSGLPADVKPELLTPGAPSGTVPRDFRPKADVPLTATALEAVRVSERWQGEKNAPSPGPDGRVMYSFGAGLPTVVCAPLREEAIRRWIGQ